mmetsp:Transcript_7627/g.11442  ORF Transcript_7627/g.11442 Transcript_7627/m.11442 type:complete len:90 (+) Transcript_7627:827-1096(+)
MGISVPITRTPAGQKRMLWKYSGIKRRKREDATKNPMWYSMRLPFVLVALLTIKTMIAVATNPMAKGIRWGVTSSISSSIIVSAIECKE